MAVTEPALWVDSLIEEVLLTHRPTGVMAKGATKGEALAKLGTMLIGRGDISINDARAAMGLKPFDPPIDAIKSIATGHLGTPCSTPREGGMCGCGEDDEPDDGPQDCYRTRCSC